MWFPTRDNGALSRSVRYRDPFRPDDGGPHSGRLADEHHLERMASLVGLNRVVLRLDRLPVASFGAR